jgi:hypothetical protein
MAMALWAMTLAMATQVMDDYGEAAWHNRDVNQPVDINIGHLRLGTMLQHCSRSPGSC